MKKRVLFMPALFILSVAVLSAQQQLPLKDVITRSARDVETSLKEGTTIAVVNFTSPSEVFSEHVIEELISELVSKQKVVVVERRNLDLIREEMNIQLSGDVSDESMLSIGHQLGANFLVSGSLTNMGKYYRFRVKVINVESARIQMQNSLNLKNDQQVTFLLTTDESRNSSAATAYFGRQKLAIGLGPELNMNSTEDAASAFGLNFVGVDYNIGSKFAIGFIGTLSFSEILTVEAAGLLRWYVKDNIFIQADAGIWAADYTISYEDSYRDKYGRYPENPPGFKFRAGLRGGIRLPVSRNFYVEPYARAGYPFMLGVGAMAGIRLPFIGGNDPIGGMTGRGAPRRAAQPEKESSFAEEVAAIVEEFKDDRIWLEFDNEGRMRLMVSVVFAPNSTEFDGLSPEIMANNERTIKYVADILKRVKYSNIIIEGHSNPTSPEGPARDREENENKLLSRLRALTVVDELRQHGVNLDRRNVEGAGTSRLVAPYNDAQNNWKNRRVEFILIQ